jgi:peptidoglycan hydrolase-like protein with peptidoglycan-binding domain
MIAGVRKTFRPRVLLGVGSAFGVLSVVVVAGALTRSSSGSTASAQGISIPVVTTTAAPTTTTTIPALLQPPPIVMPPLPGGLLQEGSSGPVVQAYQQRLADLHFDPGAIDGHFGSGTTYAIETLQKLFGTEPTGKIRGPERFALSVFRYPAPLQPNGEANRTEVDVTKQVLTLYEGYQVRLLTTTSTGSGGRYCYNSPRDHPTAHICEDANTPPGRFAYTRFVSGWDKSPLGQLYNPYYFNGGIAVHGYASVPTSPASHGCVRIPMHIAEYFHTLVHRGDPVYVIGGTPANVVSRTPIGSSPPTPPTAAPAAPGPAAPPAPTPPPPTAPPTTTTTTTTGP